MAGSMKTPAALDACNERFVDVLSTRTDVAFFWRIRILTRTGDCGRLAAAAVMKLRSHGVELAKGNKKWIEKDAGMRMASARQVSQKIFSVLNVFRHSGGCSGFVVVPEQRQQHKVGWWRKCVVYAAAFGLTSWQHCEDRLR